MSTPLLDGITVLDFTRVLAGPYCTRLLADMGARVIKIERSGEGDDTRRGYLQLEEGRADQSTYFVRVNAGKRSVALDLTRPEARAVAHDLARAADVAIENFVPGVAAKLGIGAKELRAINGRLVYCSISGFGQNGPLTSWPAFAHIIAAMSGMMDLERNGDPTARTMYLQAADVLAGTHAAVAILAALVRGGRRGEGATLDVSMLEALVAAEDVSFGAVLNGGELSHGPRVGMFIGSIGGRQMVTQYVGGPQLWARLCAVMNRPDIENDPRFATPPLRRQHWPELNQLVTDWLTTTFSSVDDALRALNAARVPAAPVLSPPEVVAHPHMAAREAFPEIPHPGRGTVRVTATPFHVDGAPLKPQGPAPYRIGEHTRSVLTEGLGYTPARVDELLRAGAIAEP
ncbi:MAG: CoA transferase [Candidatus Rokubacteria bacterium]|nr:CoA transferase [Candidatus Rokubacteria bacterium]